MARSGNEFYLIASAAAMRAKKLNYEMVKITGVAIYLAAVVSQIRICLSPANLLHLA